APHPKLASAAAATRIDRLQARLRELTGTAEELQYRNQQLEQEVQRLRAGAPPSASPPSAQNSPPPRSSPPQYPPPAMPYPAAQAPGAIDAAPPLATPSSVPSSVPVIAADAPAYPSRRGDAFDPSRNPNAPGAPRPLGSSTDANEPPPAVATTAPPRQAGAPLDLSSPSAPPTGSVNASAGSTLPPPPPITPSRIGAIPGAVPSAVRGAVPGAVPGAVQAALPPGNTPKDQYDLAYGYVLHKDFTLAVQTFHDFLRKYPSDRLAPEAQYWL